MTLNELFTEEKVRLDPKCWTGKKIGDPKTKVKGGVRVNNCVPAESIEESTNQPLSVQQLATISDEALDNAYHYGRSTPGNTFGWQANLKSAAYAKQIIDQGVTDIEAISDAIHKGWNTTAQAFVQNPDQFDDTAKLAAAGKLEAKLQQRAQLMKQNYAQLPEEEKEKDRVVARALLQAIRGEQGMAEGSDSNLSYQGNCTEDDVIEHIFGDVNNFANMVEEHGDEFTVGDLVVKYDPKTDVHSFYYKKQGVAEGWKDLAVGGAMALGALGAGAQTMPDINVKQVELANKYYNVLVQQAKEDGRELDTRTLNVLKAKAQDAAAKKTQQSSQQQGFPSQGSERKVAKDAGQFESQGVAESKPREKEADYGADYQDMVARVKHLAGLGPLKTVWDPQKRVYKNVPVAVQPKK